MFSFSIMTFNSPFSQSGQLWRSGEWCSRRPTGYREALFTGRGWMDKQRCCIFHCCTEWHCHVGAGSKLHWPAI